MRLRLNVHPFSYTASFLEAAWEKVEQGGRSLFYFIFIVVEREKKRGRAIVWVSDKNEEIETVLQRVMDEREVHRDMGHTQFVSLIMM